MLQFLLEHAPLEHWERDILAIMREEAYYFAPQGMTKIMNEGWASYWHSTIMTQRALTDSEVIDFADHHSGTVAMTPGPHQPLQDRHRAVPRHRGPLEQGQVRQGVRRLRRPRGQAALGPQARPGPPEDLRGPQDLQRRDVHRRVPDRGVLRAPQALRLRLRPAHAASYVIVDRDWRKVKERLLFSAHQPGPADHPRRGRQLRQPRRAVPEAPLRGRAPRRGEGARHPEEPAPPLAPARPPRDRGGRAAALLSFDGTEHKSTRL